MEEFVAAGRTLFSLGLVKGAEGNLSTFDGEVFVITRTGVPLDAIARADLVAGGLEEELSGASSDVEIHRHLYRERGPGAIVHAHPGGTAPDQGEGPGRHGLYTFGISLAEAVADALRRARASQMGLPS